MAPIRQGRGGRGQPTGLIVIFVLVMVAYLAGAVALSSVSSAPPDAAAPSEAGPGAGFESGLAGQIAVLAPQHLVDLAPAQRYFDAAVPGRGEGAVPGAVTVRPDLDEGRTGYIVYSLAGQYHSLSGLAQVSADAPSDTQMRVEVWGDGRLLLGEQLGRGGAVPIHNLDIAGVDQLRFAVQSTGPRGRDPYATRLTFQDPVVN